MRKLLQTTSVFILGIGLLTGCSDGKVAQNIDNATSVSQSVQSDESGEGAFDKIVDSQTIEQPVAATASSLTKTTIPQAHITKENSKKENNTQQKQSAKVNKVAEKAQEKNKEVVKNSNHDFKEAAKVLNPMEYGLVNFSEGKNNPLNAVRYAASLTYGNDDNNVKTVPVSTIVDLVNTYNAETYNISDILAKLKASGVNVVVVGDRSIETYDEQSINALIPDRNTVVYFQNDGLVALRTASGYGGASGSIFAPTTDWQVNGDEIIVPYETVATNKPTGKMILHLNNKNYEFAKNKTMYYVEKFIIY